MLDIYALPNHPTEDPPFALRRCCYPRVIFYKMNTLNLALLAKRAIEIGKKLASNASKIVTDFGMIALDCKVSKNDSLYVRVEFPTGTEGCPEGGALIASVSATGWERSKLLAHKSWKIVETELQADYTAPDGTTYAKGHRNIKAIPAIVEEV